MSLSVDGESLFDTSSGSNFSHCGGLLPNSSYTYMIEIENSQGLTSMTSKTYFTAMASIPGSPTISSINVQALAASVDVVAPCDNGGADDVYHFYQLISVTDSIIAQDYFDPGLLSLTNLNASSNYVLQTRAENDIGASNWTNVQFVTTTGIPSSPATTFLFASSAELKLAVIPPSTAGGANISIELVATSNASWEILYQSNMSCTVIGIALECPSTVVIGGLENLTDVTVAVRSIGDVQPSSWMNNTYLMDTGFDGTIGFADMAYAVMEGSSADIEVGRVYGTAYAEEITFEITSTNASSYHMWQCNTTGTGASCYTSESGTNLGKTFCYTSITISHRYIQS